MAGCYPWRVSVDVTDGAVFRSGSRIGLNPDEVTIAEVLKGVSYATAIRQMASWRSGEVFADSTGI